MNALNNLPEDLYRSVYNYIYNDVVTDLKDFDGLPILIAACGNYMATVVRYLKEHGIDFSTTLEMRHIGTGDYRFALTGDEYRSIIDMILPRDPEYDAEKHTAIMMWILVILARQRDNTLPSPSAIADYIRDRASHSCFDDDDTPLDVIRYVASRMRHAAMAPLPTEAVVSMGLRSKLSKEIKDGVCAVIEDRRNAIRTMHALIRSTSVSGEALGVSRANRDDAIKLLKKMQAYKWRKGKISTAVNKLCDSVMDVLKRDPVWFGAEYNA
jgi:hypothetical protein